MEKAIREFDHAKRYGENLAVAMMDIDFFKHINDEYGHAAGDLAIRQYGQLMKTFFRKTDVLGRMGGEEFALLMVQTSLSDATTKLEAFRKEVEALQISYQEQGFRFTVSIGVTYVDWGTFEGPEGITKEFDELLSEADACLYESKKSGRNRVTLR